MNNIDLTGKHDYEFMKIDGDKEVWKCRGCGATKTRPLGEPHSYNNFEEKGSSVAPNSYCGLVFDGIGKLVSEPIELGGDPFSIEMNEYLSSENSFFKAGTEGRSDLGEDKSDSVQEDLGQTEIVSDWKYADGVFLNVQESVEHHDKSMKLKRR